MESLSEIAVADGAVVMEAAVLPSDAALPRLELYTSQLCPFSFRVQLTLAEKSILAWEIEIDLRDKPAWFVAMAPEGKVPLLRVGSEVISGSTAICEYLDAIYPRPRLLPQDHAHRAKARIWMRFADERLYARTQALLHSTDHAMRSEVLTELQAVLRDIEYGILEPRSKDGVYMLGENFSLVDIAFYPWFEQLCVLERYFGFEMPNECRRLDAWREAVANRAPTRALCRPSEFYLQAYGRLFDNASRNALVYAAKPERRLDGEQQ